MSVLLRTTIVSVWVGLLFLLWQDGEPRPSQSGNAAVLPDAPAEQGEAVWMGLYMNGKKVGYSSFQEKRTEDGYELQDRSVLRLRMLDQNQTVHAQSSARVDEAYALRSFRIRLQSGIGQFLLVGEATPEQLTVDVDLGEQSDRHTFPLDAPIFLPSGLRAGVVRQGLKPGATFESAVFDPAAMGTQPITVRVIGREALETASGESSQAWKIVESFRGIETTVWLDDQGDVLREEGPMGLVAVRESAEHATKSGWADDALVDLMDAVAIPIDPPLAQPRQLSHLEVELNGLGDLTIPSGGRQSLRDGKLSVRREDAAASASYQLPYAEQTWAEALQPSAFVQSAHPRLRETAARILDGEPDARSAAVRLRHWVYANLEKRAVASIPNALQVLEMGAGDCNEHAVLFAGLARAAGIPTRVVAGIVYADGVFLYHAWNEVWLGRDWVSVDPAFDQMPADATHIKLVVGEPDRHIELVPVIGKLSIDVVEATPGSG